MEDSSGYSPSVEKALRHGYIKLSDGVIEILTDKIDLDIDKNNISEASVLEMLASAITDIINSNSEVGSPEIYIFINKFFGFTTLLIVKFLREMSDSWRKDFNIKIPDVDFAFS